MISLRRIVYVLAIVIVVLSIASYFLSNKPIYNDTKIPDVATLPLTSVPRSTGPVESINAELEKSPIKLSSSTASSTATSKASLSASSTASSVSKHNDIAVKMVPRKSAVDTTLYVGVDDVHKMHKRNIANFKKKSTNDDISLNVCDSKVSDRLNEKLLSEDAITWCKWALNKDGGGAVVGKSWGRLKKEEQVKFEKWNCNNVNSGNNPSCNDKWGDSLVKKWRNNRIMPNIIRCLPKRNSQIYCYHNDNEEQFCAVENVKIDFSQYRTQKRTGLPDSKGFTQSYMSVDCNDEPPQSAASQKDKEPGFTFPHLFSTQMSKKTCDVVLNGTTLLYSHDNIRNLGHTINDIMNVWLMLWLDRKADEAKSMNLLSIDALKQYNNFGDKPHKFYLPYEKAFSSVLLGSQYEGKVLCLERMLVQPHPSRGFIWEGWDRKAPCNEVGPSSLAQRFNVHSRQSFGLLPTGDANSSTASSQTMRVLMIVRKEKHNDWGSYRSSRLFKNTDEIARGIQETLDQLKSAHPQITFELRQQDMNLLSLEQQVQLVASSSVMLGMHGAGIALSNYMSVGTANCCGVLEMYPKGEFSGAQGHENMIRRAGISYKRIDIDAAHSLDDGAIVPVDEVKQKLHGLLSNMIETPSCVLAEVIEDLYLESD